MWGLAQMDIWGNGHLELMDTGASGHWGQMGFGGKWSPGKMSIRANGHSGQMGTVEQMGTLGPMDIGANEHWGKWPPGKMSTRANGYWAFGARQFDADDLTRTNFTRPI